MRTGKQAGMSQQTIESCLKDETLLDKISADQKFAHEVLHVDIAPTFFINGEKMINPAPVEVEMKIESLLAR